MTFISIYERTLIGLRILEQVGKDKQINLWHYLVFYLVVKMVIVENLIANPQKWMNALIVAKKAKS
jgi:hypothetical protein